ncbi:MAG: adenine phosphoribosyltransferase [Clostridiales bacterium]|jgi:adenine phosphoribosyltransferase|nr:adenine phosphoribosyltransferase [Clostridiales bacterium]
MYSTSTDLKQKIREIQDFPGPGVLFRDITPLLRDADGFRSAIEGMAGMVEDLEFDLIAGPESRGFIIGCPLAIVMGKGFIPVRKDGKLPFKTRRAEYELEYGRAVVEMHTDAIMPGQRVLLVDDLLATGGTARAICGLVEESGGTVAGLAFLIELSGLNGRAALEGHDVRTLLKY